MSEIWEAITGYEGIYEISNMGNVRSLNRTENWNGTVRPRKGKMMKPHLRGGIYLSIDLGREGKKKLHLIHRLVATAFIPNPENKATVNHKDFNPLNNCVDNLEWTTQKENIQASVIEMRHCHGETHGMRKLSEADIIEIRSHRQGGSHLAKIFDVSYSTIKRIRSGKLWRHVV